MQPNHMHQSFMILILHKWFQFWYSGLCNLIVQVKHRHFWKYNFGMTHIKGKVYSVHCTKQNGLTEVGLILICLSFTESELQPYLIFVTSITNSDCGDKSVMWRKIPFNPNFAHFSQKFNVWMEMFQQFAGCCWLYIDV